MKIVFGSHNYNLNSPKSDIDYLIIKVPTIEQLYDGTNINTIDVSETEDVRISDIRKIVDMFQKPNLNGIEYFNSQYVEFTGADMMELYNFIHDLTPDILRLAKYQIAIRLYTYMKRKFEESTKVSNSRAESIEKYGYDIKSLYAFFRNNIILERLLTIDNISPQELLFFDGMERDVLIDIKSGSYYDGFYDDLYKFAKIVLLKREDQLPELIKLKTEQEKENRDELNAIIDNIAKRVKEVTMNRLTKSEVL